MLISGLSVKPCKSRNLFFLLLLEIFISDAAVKTFLGVAVILFQLDESLTVTCMSSLQSAFFPHAGDVIVFRFQIFQQQAGPVAEPFFSFMLSVGIEERYHRVDDQQVDGTLTECFGVGG